jgi:hypothetical protein
MKSASRIWWYWFGAGSARLGVMDFELRNLIAYILLFAATIVVRGQDAVAQQTDLRYAYPEQPSTSPLGVDFQTGRLAVSYTDLNIGPIKLVRSWANGSNFSFLGSNPFGELTSSNSHRYGWSTNLSQGITSFLNGTQPEYIVRVDQSTFTFQPSNVTTGLFYPKGLNDNGSNLAVTAASFIFTSKAGDVYTFSRAVSNATNVTTEYGVLLNAVYADGSRLDYSYNAALKVRSVISNRGYAVILDYGTSGNVETACGYNTAQIYITSASSCAGAKLKVNYSYTGNNLTGVRDVLSRLVTISGYTAQAGPACISLPDSATCEIAMTYGRVASNGRSPLAAVDQVASQTRPNGDVINYTWDNGDNVNEVPLVAGRPRFSTSEMTDAANSTVVLTYDRGLLVNYYGNGKNTRFLYPQNSFAYGGAITASSFYRPAVPYFVTQAEGNHDVFRADGLGRIILHSIWPKGSPAPVGASSGRQLFSADPELARCCVLNDLPAMPAGSITYTQEFYSAAGANWTGCGTGPTEAKLCAKPISQTDPLNGKTDFVYYPEHGGVKSETGPLVNNVRPQTRYTYAPKYAYIAGPTGGYVQAPGAPVWVLISKSSCKVGAASSTGGCVTPGDEVVTSYEYGPDAGPNNLLLRGMVVTADGTLLRTCYSYDWLGNKVSETQPKAGGGVCP